MTEPTVAKEWKGEVTPSIRQTCPQHIAEIEVKEETLQLLADGTYRIKGYLTGTARGLFVRSFPLVRSVSTATAAAFLKFFGHALPEGIDPTNTRVPGEQSK